MVKDPTLQIDWIRAYDRSRDDPEDFVDEVTAEDENIQPLGNIDPRGFRENTTFTISKKLIEEHDPSKIIVHGHVISTNPIAAKGRLKREISVSSLQSQAGMPQQVDVQLLDEGERHGAIFDKKRIDEMLEGTPVEEVATTKKYEFFYIRSF